VQVQFYVAFPLLLCALGPRLPGFRARVAAALGVAAAAGTAWRLWSVWQAEFLELPVADFAVDQRSQLSWAHMLHAAYLPSAGRVTEMAAGAALGLLLRSTAALRSLLRRSALRSWLVLGPGRTAAAAAWPPVGRCLPERRLLAACTPRRRALLSLVAAGLQAAFIYLTLTRHLLFRPPGAAPWPPAAARLHVALLSWGSPFVSALLAATLAALALRADPLHAAAARALSSPAWQPLARLSYSLFLIHEQARLWAILALPAGWLPRLIQARPLPSLAVMVSGTLAVGYAAALPLHLLVEQPCLPHGLRL
jgi:peptidoglycan/LPS O-acetylase OafA/YrhL